MKAMSNDVLSWKYADSAKPVRKGDVVMVDDRSGVVEELCLTDSREAEAYDCEDTGGLLIRFSDGFLELLPFGHHHRIVKLQRPEDLR